MIVSTPSSRVLTKTRIAASLAAVALTLSLGACSLPDTAATDTTGQTQVETKAKKSNAPKMTKAQANARRAAENYISVMPFSRKGLIRQLSSDAGDGYSKADATKAVDSLDINYNEQAAKAAQNYLDTMPFSRKDLIKQLSSSAGDQYTQKQAEYGVKKAGL